MAKTTNNRSTTSVDRTIGQRIRQLRLQLGISQEVLARRLGLTFQQVQKYEHGANRLQVARLIQIAEVLKTTPHDIIGWDEKAQPATNPYSTELYKLAKTLQGMPAEWQQPIRALCDMLMRRKK